MSLGSILGSALSGLQASQIGIRTSSNNVANVNTPGYARTEASFTTRVIDGKGFGVSVAGVRRVSDAFLQAASVRASAEASSANVLAQSLDRFQAQVGTSDDQGSLFSRLNQAFTSISSAAVEPSLTVSRLSVASDLQSFFDEGRRLYSELATLRQEADSRIASTINRINELTAEIAALNSEVQTLTASAGDATGAQNRQSELIDELSQYLDIRSTTNSDGRVFVSTTDGVALVENGAAVLRYPPSGSGAAGVDYARVTIQPPGGTGEMDFTPHIRSGELFGHMQLRDAELPQLMETIAELIAGTADALNKAHNDATAYPPPTTLEGRNTGLLGTDTLGFTGSTTLAVVGATGELVKRIDVDFSAGTLSVDGGAASSFGVTTTIDNFVAALNGALATDGSASFTDGQLSISAAGTNGISTLESETAPSDRGGRGFSHFFGLNDLIEAGRPLFFQSGMTATDAHGFGAGQTLEFQITAPNGSIAQDVAITVAGTSFNDLLTQLNDPVNGLGRYASFSINASGELIQTPVAGFENFDVELTGDNTQRGTTTVAFSELFGLGLAATAGRTDYPQVAPRIRSNSAQLAMAKLDLSGTPAIGDVVVAAGDGRGGQALQAVMTTQRSFNAAGSFAAGSATLESFMSRVAGDIGTRSARADRAMQSAESLKTAADQKRADVEGVSLDEELANMTLFQQSYNASARLLQTAKELTDTLLNLI
ncbi:flagellar hook-associated protein FlgK [Hyphobacterium sp.]|uniref:flagellar hook-associated protein FlgK n=1 Tax=Hyphobacterium sp. TaxID=2004662 RepID=UPI003BAC7D23